MDEVTMLLVGALASLFGGLFLSWQLVLRSGIADKTRANLVGMGAVPAAFTAVGYCACALSHFQDPGMPIGMATFTISGGMIGGWVGAWIGYMTNQQKSDRPELQRQFRETIDRAQRQPQPRSVKSYLRASGLPETRANVWLYQIGLTIAFVSFWAVMYQMIDLGFMNFNMLAHIPLRLRLLGAVAPYAVPGLLWALTRRVLPALAASLGSGVLLMLIIYVPIYAIINIIVASMPR